MRSDKQNEQSKINGAKSNGPKTDEGKAKSARNASRHNLSGGPIVLLSNEDPHTFIAHSYAYLDRFAPIDPVERNLVDQMIAASWRLGRISAWECSLFEIQMDRQRKKLAKEFTFLDGHARQSLAFLELADESNVLTLFQRYQSAARRAYTTAFRALKELQGDRFNRTPAVLPEPVIYKQEDTHEEITSDEPSQIPEPQLAPELNSIPQVIRFLRHELENMGLENRALQNEPEPGSSAADTPLSYFVQAAGRAA